MNIFLKQYNMKKKTIFAMGAAGIVAAGIIGWRILKRKVKKFKKEYYDDTLEEIYGPSRSPKSNIEEGEKEKKEN